MKLIFLGIVFIIAIILFLLAIRRKNMPLLYISLILVILNIALSFFWGIHLLERLFEYFKQQ
ncbi:hypothetical protein [Polluticaenibacter yanchengensis]|uniref:Uncharacterized protein n=1 Tax=Polluticaenibacter yanchengensis TaxID=3014562 RepID=A0ABT4UL29_9BACT|nr:hypothetical protein [Chitinophagaceae bacterium LY-5]